MRTKHLHVIEALRIVFTYLLVVAALAGVGWLYYEYRECRHREFSLLARSAVNDLWVSFIETETSQRGYILTGNIYDLDLYYVSINRIEQSRGRLAPFLRVMSKEEQDDVKEINERMDLRLEQMKSTIQAFQDKGSPEAKAIVIRNKAGVQGTLRIRELKNRLENSLVSGLRTP